MLKKVIAIVVSLLAIAALFLPTFNALRLTIGSAPTASSLTVKAKDLTLVCPGAPFKSGGANGTSVTSFQPLGTAAIDYVSNLPAGAKLKQLPLTGTSAKSSTIADTKGALGGLNSVAAVALSISDPNPVASQTTAMFNAQNYNLAVSKGMNGALGANCQNPDVEQWLVGADTSVGRESLLILSNPNPTEATVTLHIFGPNGPVESEGLTGIAVPANRTTVLPIAGFAPLNTGLTVQVTATGATIASWIQQKTIRGTEAAGADLISPSAKPAIQVSIPGFLKRGTKAATALIANNDNYADLTPQLVLMVPGANSATVTVQVVGTSTKTFGTVLQENLNSLESKIFPITGLSDGDYAVFVQSTAPVLASIQLSRTKTTNTPNTDFAWLNAVPQSIKNQSFAVPKSGISELSIAATNLGSANVTLQDTTSGQITEILIPAQNSQVAKLTAGDAYTLQTDNPVASTLIIDFTGQIAAIPLIQAQTNSSTYQVLVR